MKIVSIIKIISVLLFPDVIVMCAKAQQLPEIFSPFVQTIQMAQLGDTKADVVMNPSLLMLRWYDELEKDPRLPEYAETSMSVTFLLKLSQLTGNKTYRDIALKAMNVVMTEI